MSRATTVARVAARIAGTRLRHNSGPLFYYGVAMTTIRIVRRVAGRRSEQLLLTELQPGEAVEIRALAPGE